MRRLLVPALVLLSLTAHLAMAQVNLTVTPQAPPAVESTLSKILGIAVLLTAAAGVLALLWGGFKMASGQEGGGRWLAGGVVALVIAAGINEIVQWLATP